MREVSWAWGAPALGPGCTDPDSDSPPLGKETIVSRVPSQKNISGDSNRGDSGLSPANGDGTSGSSFFPGVGGGREGPGGGWSLQTDQWGGGAGPIHRTLPPSGRISDVTSPEKLSLTGE